MKGKRYTTEDKIRILGEADRSEKRIQDICRDENLSVVSFHRWKKQFGHTEINEARRLKELERENSELKKMLVESLLKNRVLETVCEKGSMAEFVGQNGTSQGQAGESITQWRPAATRSEARKPSPPLACLPLGCGCQLNEECFVADVVENKALAYLWYVWLPTDSAEEARKEVVSPAHRRQLAASWMVTAVVGGAILPYFMGLLADRYSMRVCLLMPLGYFAFIAFYGFGWQKLYRHDMEPDSTSATVPPH